MDGRISFEFATNDADGTLLYNGPFSGSGDFVGVYLDGGSPRARIDLGGGVMALDVNQQLNDGVWHSIEIIKQNQVRVNSACVTVAAYLWAYSTFSGIFLLDIILDHRVGCRHCIRHLT